MGVVSVSRVLLRFRIANRGEAEVEVLRHLAPATVGLLIRALPVQARISRQTSGVVAILSTLEAGPEKLRGEFARGDIALYPASGHLWIFLRPQVVPRPMNPLGRVTTGIELLESCAARDVVTITAA